MQLILFRVEISYSRSLQLSISTHGQSISSTKMIIIACRDCQAELFCRIVYITVDTQVSHYLGYTYGMVKLEVSLNFCLWFKRYSLIELHDLLRSADAA